MDPGSTPSKATGSWAFGWHDDDTHNAANLVAKVSNNNADKVVINAELINIATINNKQGSTVEIELKDNSWSPFILVGDENHLAGNNLSSDWMNDNLPYIGCLNLQQLTIPGSHDAGMSEINYPAGGNSDNAQTQSMGIYNQLVAGVRYFDIRPTISHKQFYTGHYSKAAGTNLGANGQSIADVISDINRYLSYKQNELIILELTHSSFTDDDYQPFSDAQWNNLLLQFYQDLDHLYTGHGEDVLTTIPLSEFIKDGPAVVVLTNERSMDFLRDHHFLNRGFFSSQGGSNQFPSYNSYSNTNSLNKMRKDQYDKLVEQNGNPDSNDQVHVLSWTLTQDVATDILGGGAGIRDLARVANGHLAQVGSNVPYTGPVSWAAKTKPPNIILIDDVSMDRFLVSLALGLTRFYNKACS
ncbi:uncharacterized protein A1O9_10891 [Exophiala aquamarina CBS 119918]|uniref:Phosphatidylinositol-specific phospholipase C X domain-containing protein n=1 Tax=Exophiala aquamarina CBS 119918 TaxID=1182545 RepID=A0A072NYN7_9EURO|nr:uncharacterized protein A1O9_10891 [Exophiala aquamarina CBS 119918]KEF52984.1 hypothetical protein A1O9_10891 [Exophiala aquamarina CBS 119918]